MSKVIIFANQKGGVGKTTSCRELGFYFGSIGKKLLFIDADPQANLTNGLISNDNKYGLFDALTGAEYEFKKVRSNIYILSGDNRLTNLSKSLVGEIDAYTRLKTILEDERFKEFDFIFIDSRPAFDTLTINGLTASTDVIIPMSAAEYTLQGTNDLLESIAKVKKSFNPEINITGVIVNAYDSRPVITREIREEIKDVFKDKVFNTALSKTIKYEEAIAGKLGIIETTDSIKVKEEIERLGQELLTRLSPVTIEQEV
jgi:chromosome partitioning protein